MLAVLALAAFIIALILHIAGHGAAKYVIDAELIGFIFVAASLAFGERWPVFRSRP